MTKNTLRIAVLSDLHVFNGSSGGADGPSFIGTADPQDSPEKHPFRGLQRLIETENITADLLICPGDLSDKADPAALMYAWKELHKIKEQIGATHLFATSGNHDVDSRHKHDDHDPKGNLQSLVPMFPAGAEDLCDRYWSRNFAIFYEEKIRIVILNSSAFHGYGLESKAEHEHGRISSRTISALREALSREERRVNILLCHHHPTPFNPVGEEDYSEMAGGDRLIELLNSGDYGSWMIIHGHKHFPRLTYASGGASSPIIFSAGSFSAVLYPKIQARARNQFYLLEIPIEELDGLGLDLAGTLRAWDWITMIGWQAAGSGSGLRHIVGFGWRESARNIAQQIASQLRGAGDVRSRDELAADHPRLQYLLPDDIEILAKRLKADHQVTVRLQDGLIYELGLS